MPIVYQCKNKACEKTFPVYARISLEKNLTQFQTDWKRVIVEKPCCPFCESIEFEEVN